MNLAYLIGLDPIYFLKEGLNEVSVKRDGAKLRRKYLMQISRLQQPKYTIMNPKEQTEPTTVIQELNMSEGAEDIWEMECDSSVTEQQF